MLADLETVSSSLDKSERLARSGDKEAIARAEILRRAKAHLNEGKPVRAARVHPRRAEASSSRLGLITAKKVLYVANVDENRPARPGPARAEGPRARRSRGRRRRPRLRQARSRAGRARAGRPRRDAPEHGPRRSPPWPRSPARRTACSGCRAISPPAPRKSAPGQSPSAPPPRRPPASFTPTSNAASSAPRSTRSTTSSSTRPKPPSRPPGSCGPKGKRYVMKDGDITHFLFNV